MGEPHHMCERKDLIQNKVNIFHTSRAFWINLNLSLFNRRHFVILSFTQFSPLKIEVKNLNLPNCISVLLCRTEIYFDTGDLTTGCAASCSSLFLHCYALFNISVAEQICHVYVVEMYWIRTTSAAYRVYSCSTSLSTGAFLLQTAQTTSLLVSWATSFSSEAQTIKPHFVALLCPKYTYNLWSFWSQYMIVIGIDR